MKRTSHQGTPQTLQRHPADPEWTPQSSPWPPVRSHGRRSGNQEAPKSGKEDSRNPQGTQKKRQDGATLLRLSGYSFFAKPNSLNFTGYDSLHLALLKLSGHSSFAKPNGLNFTGYDSLQLALLKLPGNSSFAKPNSLNFTGYYSLHLALLKLSGYSSFAKPNSLNFTGYYFLSTSRYLNCPDTFPSQNQTA